jgi:hypothetical protein
MTAPTPIDLATTLRSEMAEHMRNAIEAALFQLAPHLVGLNADSLAVILSEELLAVVQTVQDEHLHQLAEIATGPVIAAITA